MLRSLVRSRSCLSTLQASRRGVATLQSSLLTVETTADVKVKPELEGIAFGQNFSDHMLEVEWDQETGWGAPAIVPYHNLSLDPAASVLHYGLEVFEGMKAYKDAEGRVRMYRPDRNMRRMNNSAERLSLPQFDGAEWVECMKELLKVEESWVPELEGYSLYLRPTLISTHSFVGIAPPAKCLLYVICSPVGPYFAGGFNAVKLLATTEYTRAWPGGTGAAKCGGNYASGIKPQKEATALGYSQNLWLFRNDEGREEVTEVGSMNQFFLWKTKAGEKELITAPLDDGTILPGVTRESIIDLCRAKGITVTERKYYMDEIVEASDEGRIIESFGAGTACVVCPVREIHYNGQDIQIPLDPEDSEGQMGPLTKELFEEITDIHYGRSDSEWSVLVE